MFKEVAKAIKQDRLNRGMSQKEYGRGIGFKASTISKWERLKADPGSRATWALRIKYNVDCGEIRRKCMYN